jgi:dTDP-4-amino-4,6-dideoxygalactose transaminase
MPVVLPATVSRQAIINRLRKRGIQTTIHYPPVHRLTFYRELYPDTSLLRTEDFCRRELTLPLHPKMVGSDVERVTQCLAAALDAELPVGAVA